MQRNFRARAEYVRQQIPHGGLFAGASWRIGPEAFPLSTEMVKKLEVLGPQLVAFYRACNTLYRHSLLGKQPRWVAQYLDAGKPERLLALSRSDRIRSRLPQVIRPDVILGEEDFFITELDSIPGGMGLTGWLGKTYGELGDPIVGGSQGMVKGFASILGVSGTIVVSDESAMYRPEMEWLGRQCGMPVMRPEEIAGCNSQLPIYRFFELFDLENVPNAWEILAGNSTPPPKPQLEEKMLMAFLWMPSLEGFWREHLGPERFRELRRVFPQTWIVDSTPLPPHAVIPGLEINDWRQMASFSQKRREFVLKLSGFHEQAWGAKSVAVGHDLSAAKWKEAVDRALGSFPEHPFVLQRFGKSRLVPATYYDFEKDELQTFSGRVRLCPYYFVSGDAVTLGGVLATICPSDKKVLHGMPHAVMTPCEVPL